MGMLWDRFIEKAKDIDAWRKMHMSMAEWIDAWRIVPRLIVAGYAYMLWKVVKWYTSIEPHMIKDCPMEQLGEACISQAPNTQDAVIVTAVVGIAAAVFGLYSGSGKKWNGFTHWNQPDTPPKQQPPAEIPKPLMESQELSDVDSEYQSDGE